MTRQTPQLNNPQSPAALPAPSRSRWVQTQKSEHEAWGRLSLRSPRAAALMHWLAANIDDSTNAVVASYATLTKLSGMSTSTLQRAIKDLQADRWIQVVQIGGKGGANAFVINDRVAWTKGRDKLHLSRFSATIVADREEQHQLDDTPLRRIPKLYPGEQQLPTGPGEDPPAEPFIEGMEPDLPTIKTEQQRRDDTSRHLADFIEADTTKTLTNKRQR